ncbi:murein transglycosylase A [Falsiroseomonas sp. HW251]|uniref:murein transglycosylase A n=1 Tax=Falsiroseomonas sp. HW251 TaxID=3390998 RepID=UPI003D310BC2
MRGARVALLALALFATPAVAQQRPAAIPPPPPPPPAPTIPLTDLPGWSEDRQAEAIPALLTACRVIAPMAPGAPLGGTGPTQRTAGQLAPLCEEAAAVPAGDDDAARAFLLRRFRALPMGQDTLTGYYEPELRGSLTRNARFNTPLHARPPELVEIELGNFAPDLRGRRIVGELRDGRLQPLPDRSGILAGALAGRNLEIAWVDDPVDAFFLQIQGSGRVILPDGRLVRVGYAGWNGHPYFAIGRGLVERGVMPRESVTMQSIRAWLATAGAAEATALMARNPSYVFFRRVELKPEEGPVGALGAPLVPMRAVAVDRAHVPLGLPVWVAGRDPVADAPLRRLTIAKDTGGAIRGPARADLFTGWGREAAERAGLMRDAASLWVLVPQ